MVVTMNIKFTNVKGLFSMLLLSSGRNKIEYHLRAQTSNPTNWDLGLRLYSSILVSP